MNMLTAYSSTADRDAATQRDESQNDPRHGAQAKMISTISTIKREHQPTLASASRHRLAWQQHGKHAAAGVGGHTREDPTVMSDDPLVTDLVIRARKGDRQAWNVIVERYSPLICSICRRYRLNHADINDIGQNVWLHLVDKLATIRDPAALPGWLATTTQRECIRVLRTARRPQALPRELDAENIPDERTGIAEQEVLIAERNAALREALSRLSPFCQRLIALLIEDPPVPYAEISAKLGISVGSIGPTRGRCLNKLRRDPAIAALMNANAGSAEGVRYMNQVIVR